MQATSTDPGAVRDVRPRQRAAFIFFIGIQPKTPFEQLLIEQGYLKPGYNPLSLSRS